MQFSYQCLKPILFRFDPENAHRLTIHLLNLAHRLNLLKPGAHFDSQPYNLRGLHFPNRVGIAAGFDKNAECVDALFAMGFGFVEIGTVTPLPQAGNPRPRLFRIPAAQAIINRFGFNSDGADAVVERLKQRKTPGILGVNVGKNKDTPLERAVDDYAIGLQKFYPYADYLVVNVSSPNTEGLRDLQTAVYLRDLLRPLKTLQKKLADEHKRIVPLWVKISPDLTDDALKIMLETIRAEHIDGIVATNSTLDKTAVSHYPDGNAAGGVSGQPVFAASTDIVRKTRAFLGRDFPIVGVGGIDSAQTAQAKMAAGANLIQIYSGLVYQGPQLLRDIQAGLTLQLKGALS